MDAETIRTVAKLARQRAKRSVAVSTGDGMSRLGAQRALDQLARDLDATAADLDRPRRSRGRSTE